MRIYVRYSALSLLMMVALAIPAAAQNGLTTAGGSTSLFQSAEGGTSIALDANESKIAVTFNTSVFGFESSRSEYPGEGGSCQGIETAAIGALKSCTNPLGADCVGERAAHKTKERACNAKHSLSAQIEKCIEPALETLQLCEEECYEPEATAFESCLAPMCGAPLAKYKEALAGCSGKMDCAESELKVYESCEEQRLTGWSNNLTVSVAAQKGKRELFSEGDFNPGVEVTEKFGYQRELGKGGIVAVFFDGKLTVEEAKLVDLDPATSDISTREKASTSLGLGLGVNWTPRGKLGTFGLAGTWSKNWDKPSASAPDEVCTNKATGTDSKGNPVTIASCKSRFFGGVKSDSEGDLRFDWLSPRFRLGSWEASNPGQIRLGDRDLTKGELKLLKEGKNLDGSTSIVNGASLGLIVSTSVKFRENKKAEYNVSIGPAMYKAFQPLAIVGALLLDFKDLGNASGNADSLSDKFAILLYVGVPF